LRIAVIGGGIIGASIAHELVELGAEVALYESRYYTFGATGRATGSITVQQRKPELVVLAMENLKELSKLKEVCCSENIPFACRLMDDSSPHIAVARNEAEARQLDELSRVWKEAGAEVRTADPDYLAELLPILDTRKVFKAYVTPGDYKLMPHPLTWTRVALARKRGASTRAGVGEVKVKPAECGVEITAGNERSCYDVAVVAAGAPSVNIASALGEQFRTDILIRYAAGFVTEPFKYRYKPTLRLFSESYRFLQTVRAEYVATIDNLGPFEDGISTDDSLKFLIKASKITAELMPRMQYVNILRSWGSYADFTGDGYPVVGWSKKHGEAIYYAFGFNDYGLSVSQSVAVRAAKEIISGGQDEILSKFRP
jgi:glycine/D-amino acid oxidase-like deaminating enzyme